MSFLLCATTLQVYDALLIIIHMSFLSSQFFTMVLNDSWSREVKVRLRMMNDLHAADALPDLYRQFQYQKKISPIHFLPSQQNKKPISHIAHLRKQFKSINTYDYIITLIERRKKNHYLLFKNMMGFFFLSFEQTWIRFTQECFVPDLVEIRPMVLTR